jgi:hypothetical protein
VLKRWLRIPQEEVTVARRGFRDPGEPTRRRLERVGESFLHGYHAALADEGLKSLTARLEDVELEFRGFAYEGAAMAIDLLDQLTPWRRSRLSAFLEGPGAPHTYMVHVGIGWSLARWTFSLERRLMQLDPLLRWLALDGYGFHEGYFCWPRYANGSTQPRKLPGYGLRAFDQGLGRSLWFVGGADPGWIENAVAAFPEPRRADLWSGVGLACAYAGGASPSDIHHLRDAGASYSAHLAQGAFFAAGARARAGNPAQHTDLACNLLCGHSAQEAAIVCDETRLQAQEDGEPAYEVWRRLIRTYFARAERKPITGLEERGAPPTNTNVPEEEWESAQRS